MIRHATKRFFDDIKTSAVNYPYTFRKPKSEGELDEERRKK